MLFKLVTGLKWYTEITLLGQFQVFFAIVQTSLLRSLPTPGRFFLEKKSLYFEIL